LDNRWESSNIQTLLVIQKNRLVTKTEVETNETAFFVSNAKLTKESGSELFNAAGLHWRIETDNNIRDVNFGEDEIRCFNKNTSRMMAVSISLALNLLKRRNINNNIRVLRE
jgi:predicted transposase YbfD/YdcC